MTTELVSNELDVLAALVPLGGVRIVEAGCGAAKLARDLVGRHADAEVVGLEVDERQHAKNLDAPAPRLSFQLAGAQAIPFADASFDGALMLKSLHHVPQAAMEQALSELARVLKPGGWLYVSEPVYAGPMNEIVRLFHDERVVRIAAQQALDRALATGRYTQIAERRFEVPAHFADFAAFEQRLMKATFANHQIDRELAAQVEAGFKAHQGPDGVRFRQPMHVRLLRTVSARGLQ